ncbi:MAG: ABC transporter permease [Candidatus Doudnabacteria bacterium]|nr:ABC transporter permease [Candidatus Doudnabacteria bacterium]
MFDSISFFRIVKTGFVNFWRNLSLSAAATMVMTITLVIFAVLFLLFGLTSNALDAVQSRIDISVYFKSGLGEDKIKSIQLDLEANEKVDTVVYTSATKALEEFRKKHENDFLIQQSLNELTENPLPATLNVRAKNLEDYPQIDSFLSDRKYADFIESKSYGDDQTKLAIERLNKILGFIITFGVGLISIFALIAVLVIFNTITLTIFNRREEVEIMRLVGATNWYIRGPFLVESILYGFFATVITALLMLPIFSNFLPRIALFVNPQVSVFNQNVFNYWYLIFMLFLVGAILSVVSTFLAIRKYLKI